MSRHGIMRWIRRKFGAWTVERRTRDGAVACSLPCVLCRKLLARCGVHWTAHAAGGAVVDECSAPRSKPTSMQRSVFRSYKPSF